MSWLYINLTGSQNANDWIHTPLEIGSNVIHSQLTITSSIRWTLGLLPVARPPSPPFTSFDHVSSMSVIPSLFFDLSSMFSLVFFATYDPRVYFVGFR